MAACDALVVYRTNPYVDARERAAESAGLLREMLSGMRTAKSFIRLPSSTPPFSVTLLTAEGPYADLMQFGQEFKIRTRRGGRQRGESVGGRRVRVQRSAEMRHDDHGDGPHPARCAARGWPDRGARRWPSRSVAGRIGTATSGG